MGDGGREQPVDLTFRGGERLRLGPDWEVQIVYLPGHSRGHLGVWDLKNRALYAGDALHGAVYLGLDGKPAMCPTYLHVQPYLNTARFIESLPVTTYSGCHWPVMRGEEIRTFCDESRQFVELTERLILQTFAGQRWADAHGVVLRTRSATGRLAQGRHHTFCFAMAGHLEDLTSRGLIREHGGKFRTVTPRVTHDD